MSAPVFTLGRLSEEPGCIFCLRVYGAFLLHGDSVSVSTPLLSHSSACCQTSQLEDNIHLFLLCKRHFPPQSKSWAVLKVKKTQKTLRQYLTFPFFFYIYVGFQNFLVSRQNHLNLGPIFPIHFVYHKRKREVVGIFDSFIELEPQ